MLPRLPAGKPTNKAVAGIAGRILTAMNDVKTDRYEELKAYQSFS